MIRAATAFDIKPLQDLIRRQHEASKYAGRVKISDKALADIVFGMIAQQHQPGPEGSYCAVAEKDGMVVGFMGGILSRTYHIGNRLTAQDLFLVNEGSNIRDTLAMIDGYVAWARGNSKVMEIMLSWSDALPGAERAADLYRRKGFVKTGEMFEMRLDMPAEQGAAA